MQAYNEKNSITNIVPRIPTKETFFKRRAEIKLEQSLIFPGYIFVETPLNSDDFIYYTKGLNRMSRNFIKILRYDSTGEMALSYEEKFPLIQTLDHGWCIKASRGFKKNGTAKIIDGGLAGNEVLIKEIDWHRMAAWIEVEILGKKKIHKIGLQYFEPPDDERASLTFFIF